MLLICSSFSDAYARIDAFEGKTDIDSLRSILESMSTIRSKVDKAEWMIEQFLYTDSLTSAYLMDYLHTLSKEHAYYRGYEMLSAYYVEFTTHHYVIERGEQIIREMLEDEGIPDRMRLSIETSLATALLSQHKYKEAEKLYLDVLKSKALVEKGANVRTAALSNLAVIYEAIGYYTRAVDYHFMLLNDSTISPIEKADALLNLGVCLNRMGENDQAISYSRQGLDLLQSVDTAKSKLSFVILTGNLGEFYFDHGNMDSASFFSEKSLVLAREINDLVGIAHALKNLGSISLSLGNFEEALNHFEESYRINSITNETEAVSASGRALAESYFKLGRLDDALSQANKSIRIARSISFHQELSNLSYLLYQIHDKRKNTDSAFFHYKRYTALRDSIFNIEKAREIANIRTEYETEKKEQEIASLSQQATIQALELERKNQNLIVMSILIAFLILGLVLVYMVYRQRQLNLKRKAEEVEQRLLRLQMSPHFIFNSLSSIQEFVLSGDEKSAGRYLTKFSRLIREVLDHSRSEYILLDQEVSLVENYLSLQNLKRSVPFEYEIIVDEKIDREELSIPPMFAQPFIENAIEHGLNRLTKDAKITVSFTLEKDHLILRISDNGIGIMASAKSKNPAHKSLATKITKERIELLKKTIKKDISFSMNSDSHGTSVTFNLPYQYS